MAFLVPPLVRGASTDAALEPLPSPQPYMHGRLVPSSLTGCLLHGYGCCGSQFISQAQEALTAAIASDTPQQLAEACNLVEQSGLEESEIKDHFEEAKTRIMGVIGEVRTQAPMSHTAHPALSTSFVPPSD